MGSTADKLARLDETKVLLKQLLVEKGIKEAQYDENFYRLVSSIESLYVMKSIIVEGDGGTELALDSPVDRFVIISSTKPNTRCVISGVYDINIGLNTFYYLFGLGTLDAAAFDVETSPHSTTISITGNPLLGANFGSGVPYVIYYW